MKVPVLTGFLGLPVGCLLATVLALPSPASAQSPLDWPMFGQNLSNTAASLPGVIPVLPYLVGSLKPKWVLTTAGDVSARAAVVNNVAYFPDWGGKLWAVNAATGKVIWSHQLSDYGLAAGTVSRTSPAVAAGILYIGTQYNANGPTGWLLAISANSGNLIWKTQPDTSNSSPVITASPVVANGEVFVGMTSNEEFAAADPSFVCCSARGSIVALDASRGTKLWQTFTVPQGYAGGAVWASNPVVDVARGLVYAGTGNNYSVPTAPAYVACISSGGTQASCVSADDHFDSILAVEMRTGTIKWAQRLADWDQPKVTNGADTWNVSCSFGAPGVDNCPSNAGPDYDFGSAPNEITYRGADFKLHTILGAGQKSGIYYALDPDTGAQLWRTQVGPGSSLGGIEWGSASDGNRIYVAIGNLFGIPYSAGSAGSWAALDPATGHILWQTPDPNGAIDIGPMTVVDGVAFGGSMGGPSFGGGSPATAPTMFALDASTGAILWSYVSGASVNAGASISNGMVFWGSGYSHLGIPGFTGNHQFYAFSLGGF